jgi:hypothetical protein
MREPRLRLASTSTSQKPCGFAPPPRFSCRRTPARVRSSQTGLADEFHTFKRLIAANKPGLRH